MEEPPGDWYGEAWRIEDPGEEIERFRQHARRERRRFLRLSLSAVVFVVLGLGAFIFTPESADDATGFLHGLGVWSLLLVPIGLLRLAGACLAHGGSWAADWQIGRALYGRPLLKFIALAATCLAFAGPCNARENDDATRSGSSTESSSEESTDGAESPSTDEEWGASSRAVELACRVLVFLVGLFLLIVAFVPARSSLP